MPTETSPPEASQESRSIVGRLISWLRWPLALGILAFLYTQNQDGLAQVATREIIWSWFVVAAALRLVTLLVSMTRWWLLVRAQDVPFELRDAMRLGFVGNLFNFIVPGTIGGDLTKVALAIRKKPEAKAVVAATVVLDRVLGLFALVLVGALASLLHSALWAHPEIRIVMMLFLGGSAAGIIGILVALHPVAVQSRLMGKLQSLPKVGGLITKLCKGVALYQSRRRVLLLAVVMGLVVHSANISALVCCGAALGLTEAPTWLGHFFIVPVAEIAAAFLPLPGGIGAREGALQYLFGVMVNDEAAGLAGFLTGVSFSLLSIVVALAGGTWVLLDRRQSTSQISDAGAAVSLQPGQGEPAA